jgi:hypothetical protein
MAKLREIMAIINNDIDAVMEDPNILPGHVKYIGQYVHHEIKKEEITFISKLNNVLLFQHEFFTSTLEDLDKINYENSKANNSKETPTDLDEVLNSEDDTYTKNFDAKNRPHMLKEVYSKHMSDFLSGVKIVYESKMKIENAKSTLKLFFILNSKNI